MLDVEQAARMHDVEQAARMLDVEQAARMHHPLEVTRPPPG